MKRNLLRFVLLSVMSLVTLSASAQQGGEPDYLCFTANEDDSKVVLFKEGDPTAVELEFKINDGSWIDYNFTTKVVLTYAGNKVYFRHKGTEPATGFSKDNNNYYGFIMEGSISASGNVMSLVDQSCQSTTIPAKNCFTYLFNKCTALTTAPELPATTLTANCYKAMFYKCTALTEAPELPATTLANYCYQAMFYGCTSLTEAPEISATTMAESSCMEMFCGCTELTEAPALPATTLANSCYIYMFQKCTKLKTAPAKLPATTLAASCYEEMFDGCTALTTAPEISATTMAENSCKKMFQGCTKLETAPAKLPATTLAVSCYEEMFNGCTALTTAPEISATTMAENSCKKMFSGCTSLTTAPALLATTLANNCCIYMFQGCTNLETAPAKLPAATLAVSCYEEMFNGCTALTTAPEISATTMAENSCKKMFSGCTSLTTAPALLATTLANSCCIYMFQGCTNLETAPELPAETLADFCYNNMFNGCTSLTAAPELPATTMKKNCYLSMFSGCTSLEAAPELPATELAESCYNGMFNGCTSLKAAPELPATTLATTCYKEMFAGSAVDDIKVAFTSWSNSTELWVEKVTGNNHTITCSEALNASYKKLRGKTTSNIPSGWTVKTTYDLVGTTAGWASMCVNLPLTVPEGAEVYYAFTALGGNTNTIALRQIKPGTVMAAKTAVIVKADASTTVSFPIASEEGVNYYEDIVDERNLFQGTSVDKTCEAGSVYVLAGADQDGMPLFRLYVGATTDATTVTLGAHKIWLPYDEVLDDAEAIQFRFDDATAISNVPMESNDNAIYNLAGQRVSSDYRGLVIKNGKKTWNN